MASDIPDNEGYSDIPEEKEEVASEQADFEANSELDGLPQDASEPDVPNVIDSTEHMLNTAELAFRIGWQWADFQLYIISPSFPAKTPPAIIHPDGLLEGTGTEFVYTIMDYGFKLATSKSEDMLSSGMSMCKLYYTIEKMIYILIERLKKLGTTTDTEVQVAFGGFVLAQRKGFESIINLNYNVVVTNFEPGEWGELYLQTIKRLANKGYGYPPEAPRDYFKHTISPSAKP